MFCAFPEQIDLVRRLPPVLQGKLEVPAVAAVPDNALST